MVQREKLNGEKKRKKEREKKSERKIVLLGKIRR